jgi:hypothetical protein
MRRDTLSNFKVVELWQGPESKLNAAERRFIRQRKTFIDTGWGYNLTTGGGRYKLSNRVKRKLARLARAQWQDVEIRAKHAVTPSTVAKLRLAIEERKQRGDYHTVESRKKISRKVKRASKRAEVRDKHEVASKAYWSLKASHDKASKAAKIRCTPEWRAAVSKRASAVWDNPVYKAAMKAKFKASWAATREKRLTALKAAMPKIKAGLKRYWERSENHVARAAATKKALSSAAVRKRISDGVKAQIALDPESSRKKKSQAGLTRWRNVRLAKNRRIKEAT